MTRIEIWQYLLKLWCFDTNIACFFILTPIVTVSFPEPARFRILVPKRSQALEKRCPFPRIFNWTYATCKEIRQHILLIFLQNLPSTFLYNPFYTKPPIYFSSSYYYGVICGFDTRKRSWTKYHFDNMEFLHNHFPFRPQIVNYVLSAAIMWQTVITLS